VTPTSEIRSREARDGRYELTAMHPAVFDGVTNKEERNGGAYSNTKRLTISKTKILRADQQL